MLHPRSGKDKIAKIAAVVREAGELLHNPQYIEVAELIEAGPKSYENLTPEQARRVVVALDIISLIRPIQPGQLPDEEARKLFNELETRYSRFYGTPVYPD
jgi:hypothetical protein